jgi:CubicO group peptidase (beta-lactamase class C family)
MPFTSRQIDDAASIIDPLLRLSSIYGRVPGVAYGLSYDGETVLLGAQGLANVETGEPVDAASTAFRCASITKTFTATVIMQLVERGKLRLDDPVVSHLAWAKRALGRDVTVRHLLVHAGSIIRDGSNAWLGEPMPDRATLRRELAGAATFGEPAERFRYSNIAYSLLGEIAETVSGRTFETLVRANVVRPLGLESTWPDLTPAAANRLAMGYTDARPNEQRAKVGHVKARAIAPAGGLVSTVPDLLEYMRAQMPGDERLLSDFSKREMQHPQWLRAEEPNFGLSWMTWHVAGVSLVGHSGGYPGFSTMIGFAPQERLAAAVLTNTVTPSASTGVDLIYEVVAGVRTKWTDATATTKWHTRGSLAPYTGIYRLSGSDLLVSRINGSLYLLEPSEVSPLANPIRLEPRGKHTFLIAEGNDFGFLGETVTFGATRQGAIETVSIGANHFRREDL